MSEALADGLKGRGHDVQVVEMNSGLQGIQRLNVQGQTVWFGGADPRREGVALGNEGSQAWRRRALRDVVRPPGRDDALTCPMRADRSLSARSVHPAHRARHTHVSRTIRINFVFV